jgi:hypothetical protein
MLFYYALRRMPAGMAGLGTLASPIVGVLAAWLQLGEYPTPVEAIGMGLIGVALAMLARSPEASGRVTTRSTNISEPEGDAVCANSGEDAIVSAITHTVIQRVA